MNDVIRHGRAAWDRLKKGSGLWADWTMVGHALIDGRKIALHNAGIQRAHGSGYTDAFSSWMIDNNLNVPPSARAKLFTLMENLPAVEAWRANLTETQRERFNHPSAVLRNYRKTSDHLRSQSEMSAQIAAPQRATNQKIESQRNTSLVLAADLAARRNSGGARRVI